MAVGNPEESEKVVPAPINVVQQNKINNQAPNPVRKVVQSVKPTIVTPANKTAKKEESGMGVSPSFLSNRKVICKDESLPETHTVIVSNFSVGTSEAKLRKLGQTMGEVQVRLSINVLFYV